MQHHDGDDHDLYNDRTHGQNHRAIGLTKLLCQQLGMMCHAHRAVDNHSKNHSKAQYITP